MTGRARDILADLVAFDTTSSKSNLALLDYVEDLLGKHDIQTRRISRIDGKANLWATIGPDVDGGLILSGHTDCVPVEGQRWSTDPFILTEKDGRLIGRGTSDMKGFLACVLSLVPEWARQERTRPIHLAFSYDEEIGCWGVRDMIDELARENRRPSMCIVGEPTEMHAVIGQKGGRAYRCRVKGLSSHSSLAPRGVNAIETAAELIVFLRGLAREWASGPLDNDFDIAQSTISVGRISGGMAVNVVPDECHFDFEYRTLPSVDQQELFERLAAYADDNLLPQMRENFSGAEILFEPIYEYPAHSIPRDHLAVRLVKQCLRDDSDSKVAFGTEAGLFQRDLRVPSVICGPGQISVAHKPDEFVKETQLNLCVSFLREISEKHTLA